LEGGRVPDRRDDGEADGIAVRAGPHWGKTFADEQIVVESGRTGLVDYAGIWKKTLMLSVDERSRRLQDMIKQYRKPPK